jgi:hypothetical protein
MKLTYRGISYDSASSPAPQMGETTGTGRYRGAPVAFRALANLPDQPAANVTWRGVPYRAGIMAPADPANVVPVVAIPAVAASLAVFEAAASPAAPVINVAITPTSIPDLARNLFIRRHQRSRRREQGMMVRLAAEVGMPIEDAAHYESHIQGKMPHDFSGYDRGSAAMS